MTIDSVRRCEGLADMCPSCILCSGSFQALYNRARNEGCAFPLGTGEVQTMVKSGDKSVDPVRCDDVRGRQQEPLRLDLFLKLSRITPVICSTQGTATDQKMAPGRRALPVRWKAGMWNTHLCL